ncbi:MAG: WG repeat-containing protein [Anaerolineae bacterium]
MLKLTQPKIFFLSLFMLLSFLSLKVALAAPPPQTGDQLSLESLKNAEYVIPDWIDTYQEWTKSDALKLANGEFRHKYDESSASEFAVKLVEPTAFGDLNQDGLDDAAAILAVDGGGSGTFYYLAAVINEQGQPKNRGILALGDRSQIKSVTIDAGQVVVNMVISGPQDAASSPTLEVTRTYTLTNGKLVQAGPFPFSPDGNLYGYVDLAGQMVITPQFTLAANFVDDLAAVLVDNKYGYVDPSGAMVIEPQFGFAGDFSNGLAVVEVEGKYGFIDQTGQMVIKPQFDSYSDGLFHEGLAVMVQDEKYGYIDQTGQWVIKPQFDFAGNFAEGLAATKTGDQITYIDPTGQAILKTDYAFAGDFSEGLAFFSPDGVKYGYIDQTGQVVTEPQFTYAGSFAEGLAAVTTADEKVGYIDTTGHMVIKPQFKAGGDFSEGFAFVAPAGESNLAGYIDKTGQMVIKPQFMRAEPFRQGVAKVETETEQGYIDQTGNFIIKAGSQASLDETTIVEYTPAIPTETKAGSCWTTSLSVNQPFAWRCMVGNEIFDPCLLAEDGKTLVCGADPSTGATGFQLQLTEALPQPDILPIPTPKTSSDKLTGEMLTNAAYIIPEWADIYKEWSGSDSVKLTKGEFRQKYDETAASEFVVKLVEPKAFGDINGDGVEDAAVILTVDGGGSGTFYYLAVVIDEQGQPKNVATTPLGDRSKIKSVAVDGAGQVVINMVIAGPDDPACCATQEVTWKFELQGTELGRTDAEAMPWLIQLADGTTCNFATGATAMIKDKRANYLCSDNSSILGSLRPGLVWTAERVADADITSTDAGFTASKTTIVNIATIWQPVDANQSK